MQETNRLLGIKDRWDKVKTKGKTRKKHKSNRPECGPKYQLETKTPHVHSGSARDRQDTTKTKLPQIPEVVWQQPLETSLEQHKLKKFNNDSAIKKTNRTAKEPENRNRLQ